MEATIGTGCGVFGPLTFLFHDEDGAGPEGLSSEKPAK